MEKTSTFRSIAISLLTFLIANAAYSQPADNYYSVKSAIQTYYNSHPELKSVTDGSYAHFLRWQEFWRTRVDNGSTSTSGDFSLYTKALGQFQELQAEYLNSSSMASNWQLLGPTNDHDLQVNGLVSTVYIDTIADTSMNTIYIGTNSSGVWKTVNGGQTWRNITDDSGFIINGITDIAGDPQAENTIYIATGGRPAGLYWTYGTGIFKSTDGGDSWTHMTPFNFTGEELHSITRILIDPTNSSVMYVLCDSLLIRTLNNWTTYDTILSVSKIHPVDRHLRDIEMKPGNPTTLYVSSDCFHPWAQIFLSQLWRLTDVKNPDINQIVVDDLTPMLPNNGDTIRTEKFEIAVSRQDPSSVFVAAKVQDTIKKLKIWKSANSGNTWKNMHEADCGLEYGPSMMELLVSPTDTGIVYLTGFGMRKIIHWDSIVGNSGDISNYHIDTRDAKILRGSNPGSQGANDILFVGNDGGISKSVTGNSSWTNINGNGLTINQFWKIGDARNHPEIIAGGTQDNAFFKYTDGIWKHSMGSSSAGADMAETIIDPDKPDTIYVVKFNMGSFGAGILKTIDGGINWDETGPALNMLGDVYYNRPLIMNPKNSQSIYVSGHNICNSINGGLSWDSLQVPQYVKTSEVSNSLALAASDTVTLIIGYIYQIGLNPPGDSVKILKRNSNGEWINLTTKIHKTFKSLFYHYQLTDIEISETNKDSIWVSFGGFWSPWDSIRVIFSPDGGDNWQDISKGLPNFPVNCIKYWKSEGGGLFAGTDVGVFYRGLSDDQWHWFNYRLPKCIVTDLEINDSVNRLRAATYGRGVYESDLNCHYSSDTLVIAQDTTWTTDLVLDRGITINPNVTLTIKCKVALPTSAKIYVKQQAKLIVDSGGILTNTCFSNWQGIEVWGCSNQSQYTSMQGEVYLRNGARLENSRIGITTCRKDTNGYADWNTFGGVIICDSAVFRNNYKAIEFFPFKYTQRSNFSRCVFETTKKYIDTYQSVPTDFVSLYEVNAVRFLGCIFRNISDTTGKIPGPNSGRGIYSINGSFVINELCMDSYQPCQHFKPCIFSGLYYAIKGHYSNPAHSTVVNKTFFDNNKRGIYLGAIDYPVILRNTFLLPGKDLSASDTMYGLYLDNSTGYSVQENTFRANKKNASAGTIGIVINNSGTEPNEIYNNRFDSVQFGVIAQDQNRSKDGLTGLVLKCNNYYNTQYDKIISLSNSGMTDWGIALYQGDSLSQTGPAGNTFSPQHSSGTSDIDNNGARFKYYHHYQPGQGQPRVRPDYYSNVTVRSTGWSYIDSICCPSRLNGGGSGHEALKQTIAGESDTINSKETALTALVDGGNTDSLNMVIITSLPPEALELRNQLLGQSPYLSDTSMQSAILKEEVLPNEMIRDVLVANPQAATSEKILTDLDNRFIPMPDSMMAEIMAGEALVSAKEAMESEIAAHKSKRALALNELIRFYRNDNGNVASHDSLIELLQQQPDLSLKYQLASEYLQSGDTINLNTTLAAIPSTFILDSQQSLAHEHYLSWFSVMKKMVKEGKTIFDIDSSTVVSVQALFSNATEPVRSYSRNILIARGSMIYHEPILLPDPLKSGKEKRQYKAGKFTDKSYLKLFPNPARQYVIVEYNLKDKFTANCQISLIISSVDGTALLRRNLFKQQDQDVIATSSVPNGAYICSLTVDGRILDAIKFIVIN
jgi:hypothetical protein